MEAELEKLNRQPENFRQEIKGLIKDNQLDLATKRVMDFAEDFAVYKKRKYEAIDFQRRYCELRENKRKSRLMHTIHIHVISSFLDQRKVL